MKTLLIITSIFCFNYFLISDQLNIKSEDLNNTCKVLYLLTEEAIDDNRKDLVTIYYNAYKAIRIKYEITDDCDRYFEEIKSKYKPDVGKWTIGLDFPPVDYLSPTRNYDIKHKELELLKVFNELNLEIKDLEQIVLLKGIQNNIIDLKILKNSNLDDIKELKDNLNKLKIKKITPATLNKMTNETLVIEQLQNRIEKK